MGYARIISGGPTGRYAIELDYGAANKTAALAGLTTLLERLDADILALQVKIDEADADEAAQLLEVQAAQNELILLAQSGLPPGSPELDTAAFNFEVFKLRDLQKNNAAIRLRMQALEAEKAVAVKRVAHWNAFEPLETRNAWCVDLTEDAEPGAIVGTVDIPGESNLLLIAPGCRPFVATDGALFAREVLSPAQCFFNAAILPGWQKFQPTYRWGTLTAVDKAEDTGDVTLEPAFSSAQRSSIGGLNVNQTSALTAVPIVYGSCNSSPFVVGDEVVVQFIGQDWTNPRIIGFLDNPRSCNWPCIGEGEIDGVVFGGLLAFESFIPALFDTLVDNDSLDVRASLNGGAWTPIPWTESLNGRYELPFVVINPDDPGTREERDTVALYFRSYPGSSPPNLKVAVCSMQPPHPSTGRTRNVVEFAVYISGSIVFNIAMEDRGNGGGTGAAKSTGGIALRPDSDPVTLLDYTLISSTL
jgi:hypothetical protein